MDGSTTFIDEKGHTLTAHDDAQIDTAQSMFGGGSALFTILDRITSTDSADWHFGSGDFTIEMFARFSGLPGGDAANNGRALASQYVNTGNQRGWIFRLIASGLNFLWSTDGLTSNSVTGAFSPTLNTWYYLAAVRLGTAINIYAALATDSTTTLIASGLIGSSTIFDSNADLRIGTLFSSTESSSFEGWMDEIRITKGIARDVTNVPTSPFPDA